MSYQGCAAVISAASLKQSVSNKVLLMDTLNLRLFSWLTASWSICKHFAAGPFDQAERGAPTLTGWEKYPREDLHSGHFHLLP